VSGSCLIFSVTLHTLTDVGRCISMRLSQWTARTGKDRKNRHWKRYCTFGNTGIIDDAELNNEIPSLG
jgi:hypothetical protein